MKKLFFTQRVEIVSNYNERRDSADQKIAQFIRACGYLPIPLCNMPDHTSEYLEHLNPDGIVLTGGNDLHAYGGNAPERDLVERIVLKWVLNRNIPLLGICRGMQVIADFYGAKLKKVEGHIASRHMLSGTFHHEVNSYHAYMIHELPQPLEPLAYSVDGVIEAMRYRQKSIVGIMWHPEREESFQSADIQLFQEIFQFP